ncbi:MAG: cytochrome C peroxidase [Prosthecobacter sp.]|jgi:cytochrome c peroxidase|nr:cytochrome C peroxidase [Prosthecobacter sp.]
MSWRGFSLLLLLTPLAEAAELRVIVRPLWRGEPLVMHDTRLVNAAGTRLSITRLSLLLSHAELQEPGGRWIGAKDWAEHLDAGKGRLEFRLNGVPPGSYTGFRFDLGLDEATDQRPVAQWPAGHPLNPEVNGMHWSWRGGFVFCALEGRYVLPNGELGGYSYHLAGQSCQGTVVVAVNLDLSQDATLVLNLHAERFFEAVHTIHIAEADSTHSADEDPLAGRLADNAVHLFGVEKVTREPPPAPVLNEGAELPDWFAAKIPAHFPKVRLPADNPPTLAGVALGRTLFHDTRLSVNNSQSCASCHSAAHALSDPRRFSIGAEGRTGQRQAMPLFNLAWKPAFFWDGRALSLREQVLMPIQDPDEMHETLPNAIGKIRDLAPDFEAAFGTPEISADRIAKALEQHLLSLFSGDSAMDRTVTDDKTLCEIEQRGFTLFFTESDPARGIRGADCFHCHGGAFFTNHQFLNNGLDADAALTDEGRAKVTGKAADRGKFMVPSLRNVALTAPYMHDGRFTTLEEVIEHYDHGVKPSATLDPNLAKHLRHGGLGLTVDEKAALVAFLKTLTDESFAMLDRSAR